MKIPESPDDRQKRFQGQLSGTRGGSFGEILQNTKKAMSEKLKKKLRKVLKK